MSDSKKGKSWLAAKLQEGSDRLWHESDATRFSLRHEAPYLVSPPSTHTDANNLANNIAATRRELHASLVVDLLSIQVRARDKKKRGKLVQTWLRGSLIRRVIERPKPNRDGISHDRYTILIGFLCLHGIAETDGRNGYQWTPDFHHLKSRAEWLTQFVRREGELRTVKADCRFELVA